MGKYVMLGIAGIIILFSIIGMIATCSTIPNQNNKIVTLEQQVKSLNAKINQYKVAMNYEKLFLLLAKPDTIMLMGDLEDYIESKADFCLERTE